MLIAKRHCAYASDHPRGRGVGSIQYTEDAYRFDQAGHRRQYRQAEDRVILAAMAVWPDGSHQLLHYTIAVTEDADQWQCFFAELIARGLDAAAIELVISDGTKGLLAAMAQRLPHAQQQRYITHKVRGMQHYFSFQALPTHDDLGRPLATSAAKEPSMRPFRSPTLRHGLTPSNANGNRLNPQRSVTSPGAVNAPLLSIISSWRFIL